MRRLIVGGAALAALLIPVAGAAAAPADFAIIGDTPYVGSQVGTKEFPSHIQDINADPSVKLVVHLGDIKNGSTRCDTSYFNLIKADVDQFARPFVYTPGDNEWTDCHRTTPLVSASKDNGGYQPAGPQDTADLVPNGPIKVSEPSRLDTIRRIFFPTPGRTLGQTTRRVQAQRAPYVENVTWDQAGVQFGVINVPGSNNDLLPWFCPTTTLTPCAADTPALQALQADEYAKRNAADLRWLGEIFDEARDEHAAGVVIGIQADMWDPAITGDPVQYSGYTQFVNRLASLSRRFGKPVLLMNGDSHVYNGDGGDYPLADPTALNSTIYGVGSAVPNLRRLVVDGSTTTNLFAPGLPAVQDYVRLHVDASSPGVFSWTRVPYTFVP